MVSLCMQVVCWVVVVPGMWVEGDRFYNSGGEADYSDIENMNENKNAYAEDLWEVLSFVLFCGGNSVYVVVSLTMVLARVVEEKRGRQWEWVPRKRVEYCREIVTPGYSGLGLFHHLTHRLAMIVNIVAAFSGADALLSSFMVIITFLQCILSYLYSTDIALCNCCCLCINIVLIRRQPRLSLENSWMYEEWRVGPEEMGLVQEPWRGAGGGHLPRYDDMGSYQDYLYLTSGDIEQGGHSGVENDNFVNTAETLRA